VSSHQPFRFARSALTLAAAGLFITSPLALAQTSAPNDPQRVQELEQRLQILERKLEIKDEDAAAKSKEIAIVSAGDKGFGLKSASGDYTLNFKLLTQFDSRNYLGGSPLAAPVSGTTTPTRDSFLFRRIEPTFEGTLGKLVGYRLTLRLDGDRNASTTTPAGALVQDVFVDLKFDPLATVRAGKWKEPLTLENLQNSGAIVFNERGYPTVLTGNRDFGVAVLGSALTNRLNYTLGVFNGAADNADAPANDTDGRKELVGRIFAEPFKNDYGALRGLGFGLAGSTGTKKPTTVTPTYVSQGQVAFFKYNTATTTNGDQTRLVPQAFYYYNGLGLLGEYVQSRQDFVNGSNARSLTNEAYELTASYLLTGEDAAYTGVKPKKPFTVGGPGWGAVELVARHGALRVDSDAFAGAAATRLADPTASARVAKSYGAGVNWYLTQNVRLSSDFDFTQYDGGAAGGGNRADERAVFTRAQLSF
jgi:phosphate-selective porin OprO and OprP